jgi:perosamine synthetase
MRLKTIVKKYKMPKTIFTGFGPNITSADTKTAWGLIFKPWKWRAGNFVNKAEDWLKEYFQTKFSFVFDSGRTSLHYALKSLEIGESDEVIVQSYTCMVVSNAIVWTGAKPVYVDVGSDFNIDVDDLNKKITQKTKVIIIQHTFGIPADIEGILETAKEHDIKIIEDCAHALGAKYNNKLLGTFGDIGMFSFGSDKVISCVRGGGVITNNDNIAKKLKDFQSRLPESRLWKIKQHLLHIIYFSFWKKTYGIGVGKWILGIARKLHITASIIYKEEKRGKQPIFYPALLPNALAKIFLNQTKNLENFNNHRMSIAQLYSGKINNPKITKPEWNKNSIWLRYTILVDNPTKLHTEAKKQGILLGNWYNTPIAPCDIDINKSGYKTGSCPNAERLSSMSINLPTNKNITEADAEKIITLVNNYGN